MANELILIIRVLIDFAFIQVIFRWNKQLLLISIVLNLIFITIFGSKLISLFGFTTNSGNTFYAGVFFATQLITEAYGKKEGYKSIWIGALGIVFFSLMAQLTILQIGLPQTRDINYAIEALFEVAPRIAIASLAAYVVSQFVNISLFSYLKEKTKGKKLFLRINISNIVGQFIDSVVFFSVAFLGTASTQSFVEILVTGYVVKVCIGFLSTPLFYLGANSKEPSQVEE